MRTIGVIPARWGSTRFPGKSLAMLCGKPMIQRVYERAAAASRLDMTVVATDDERIRAAVVSFGGKAVMTRSDHPTGTDRVAEAVGGFDADVVINIQGDEPLIAPATIDSLEQAIRSDGKWDMATAVTAITDEKDLDDPSVVKAVWAEDGGALYFSRYAIPFDRDGRRRLAGLPYWRHLGIYAYRREFLMRLVSFPPCFLEETERLEQLRALYHGGRIKVVKAAGGGVAVDTPGDVAEAENAILREGGSQAT